MWDECNCVVTWTLFGIAFLWNCKENWKEIFSSPVATAEFSRLKTRVTVKALIAELCPTFCNPTDCSLPGSSVHGILQARKLEWVTIPFSSRSSAEYIMQNARLGESQAEIKVAGENMNNIRYADDTTLMAESEEG